MALNTVYAASSPTEEPLEWRTSCAILYKTQRYIITKPDLVTIMSTRYEKRDQDMDLQKHAIIPDSDYGVIYQKLRKSVWEDDPKACQIMGYATQCEKNMRWFESLYHHSQIVTPTPQKLKKQNRTTHGLMRFMARNMYDIIENNPNHQIDLYNQYNVKMDDLQKVVSHPVKKPPITFLGFGLSTEETWMKKTFLECYNDYLSLGDDLKEMARYSSTHKNTYHS
jgi:hypothetical protein